MFKVAAKRISLVIGLFGAGVSPVCADSLALQGGAGSVSALQAAATNSNTFSSEACIDIAAPARRLETVSKYDQKITSKSLIDPAAAARRENRLAPVQSAIAQLAQLSGDMASGSDGSAVDCAARSLVSWARAKALTDMATSDANLTRDRFVVDISLSLASLRSQGRDLSSQADVRAWLEEIGTQIIAYYDWKAGAMSARNNHRYWAGLAVGHIGYFLRNETMVAWAKRSFDIGACQIDEQGFLPLELARAEKALDYHLYAYRALAGFDDLARLNGDTFDGQCRDRLARLESLLEPSNRRTAVFEARSGFRQDLPSRQNLNAGIRATASNKGRLFPTIYGGL